MFRFEYPIHSRQDTRIAALGLARGGVYSRRLRWPTVTRRNSSNFGIRFLVRKRQCLQVGNIADAHPTVRNGVKYLSLKRFAMPYDYERIMAAVNGKVPSWNARVEKLWSRLDALNAATGACATLSESGVASEGGLDAIHQDITQQREQAMRDLLMFYLQRPGVLLRTLTRFVHAGLTREQRRARRALIRLR